VSVSQALLLCTAQALLLCTAQAWLLCIAFLSRGHQQQGVLLQLLLLLLFVKGRSW
jgi:hypothetical protein